MPSPQILIPGQPQQQDKVFVLEHHQNHRLFMVTEQMLQHPFFANLCTKQGGFIKHEVQNAAEYDKWAKRIIEQERERDQESDYLMECRQDEVRKRLRDELTTKLLSATPQERRAIEVTLATLDYLQKRKERKRDSFFMQQAYEANKATAAEQVVEKIITNA